jgi:hypothetical protein
MHFRAEVRRTDGHAIFCIQQSLFAGRSFRRNAKAQTSADRLLDGGGALEPERFGVRGLAKSLNPPLAASNRLAIVCLLVFRFGLPSE